MLTVHRYPQDLSRSINSLLFFCASKPGLSRVLLSLYDFQGPAIRCRKPTELRAGPRNEIGWFIGRTMRECQLEHGWGNGIVIGCDNNQLNFFDEEGDDTGYGGEGAAGIVGDPRRVVAADDTIIFVSRTSMPSAGSTPADRGANYAAEAAPLQQMALAATAAHVKRRKDPMHILLCGWRPDWDVDMQHFKVHTPDFFE